MYSYKIFSRITEPDRGTVIYLHGGELTEDTVKLIDGENFALVFVEGLNWNDDTTPWPAEGVFRGGSFGGKADGYLKILREEIIPKAEAELGFVPRKRGIAGYSLGGLLAIYSMFRTECFQLFASMSGSLWYDGFTDFVRKNMPRREPLRVYFSLGDREKRTKNLRMAKVEAATLDMKEHFEAMCPTAFELNPGNHFADTEKRIAAGINYLLEG